MNTSPGLTPDPLPDHITDELSRLRAKVKELEADYESVCQSNKTYEREVPQLRHRIKELEEAMPDAWELTLIAMSQRVAGREDLYKKLEEMIRKIEKVSKSK
jgi:predicted  nucleic acid-binding Zn-ribbon protein